MTSTSPASHRPLARIRKLYEVEAEIRVIRPSIDDVCGRNEVIRSWSLCRAGWKLEDHLPRISGASDLAQAMRYTLRRWSGLVVFLGDGRVEMDTNVVERAIRPASMTRKAALFADSGGEARHWAIAMTLL